MEKALDERLQEFRSKAQREGEKIALRHLPAKLLELDDLVTSLNKLGHAHDIPSTSNISRETNEDAAQSKKRKLEHGEAISLSSTSKVLLQHSGYENMQVMRLEAILRQECQQLLMWTDVLKIWIHSLKPKYEIPIGCEGKFPSSHWPRAQAGIEDELTKAQESAINMCDFAYNNHRERGRIFIDILAHPEVADYALALEAHDSHQLFLLRQCMADLRGIYHALTDLMQDHVLKEPRGDNGFHLHH